MGALLHLPYGRLEAGKLWSCSRIQAAVHLLVVGAWLWGAAMWSSLCVWPGSPFKSPHSGVCRAAADNDFLHNMIRKAVEGKDINHKGQGRAPTLCAHSMS